MSIVRLAFVGAGSMARVHLRNASKFEDVEVVGVYDIDRGRAEEAAREAGTTAFGSLDELVEEGRPDAAVVSIPPFAHGEEVDLRLARAGVNLFVEKPVALSLDVALKVLDALRTRGLVGAVGYHWRHWETTREAKWLLEDEEVVFAGGTWQGGIYHPKWWRRRDMSGGQVVEQTTHIFDLVRHLVGEVRRVFALARRGVVRDVPDYDIDDATVVAMECGEGIPVVITSTCALDFGHRVGLSVAARGKVVEVGMGTLRVIERGHVLERRARNDPYVDELRGFVDAVKEGNPEGVLCPYVEGVRTLAATLAAMRSAEEGRPVEVEEVT